MKLCKHTDVFGKCNQQVQLYADTESETEWVEWLTGRKTFDGEEVSSSKRYPLKSHDLCFYHNKKENQ